MAFEEATAPSLQTGNLAYPADRLHHQPIAVAFREENERQKKQRGNHAQQNPSGSVERQVAIESQCQIDENRTEPEADMREHVHHGIEDDRRGGRLLVDVFRQFHDAVGLTAQTAYRGGIIQGVSSDGEFHDAPETHFSPFAHTTDDTLPCQGVDAVDDDPNAEDRYQPITRLA